MGRTIYIDSKLLDEPTFEYFLTTYKTLSAYNLFSFKRLLY